MTTHKSHSIWKIGSGLVGLVALLAILIAANVIIENLRLRADFTEEKLYTLSEGTLNILESLDQPVTLKLFFSSSNPKVPTQIKTYARQVEDLLKEYRLASDGKIKVVTLDPKPDSDAEEWARKYGISGQALEMFGPPIYLGLVAASGKNESVLPALDPRMQQKLEFKLSRMLNRVTHPEKPVIGVLSSLPVLGTQAPPRRMPGQPPQQQAWVAFQELQADYEMRNIDDPEKGIPAEIQTLLVIHPKSLSETVQYAIDQFVLRGGHVAMFVDPLSVADQSSASPSPYGRPKTASDAPTLLNRWGIGYDASKVLADYAAATPMRTPGGGVERNPAVVSYGQANVAPKDIITTKLDTLRAAFAGALVDNTTDAISVTSLLTGSNQSGLINAMSARMGGSAIRSQFKPSPTPQHLALKLTGTFQTAFPDGKPKSKADAGDTAENEAEASADATAENASLTEGKSVVIVVADVDILFDQLCVEATNFFGQQAHRPLNDNLAFFANMVETMAGSSDLIGIRSRGTFNRPFTTVDKLEAEAVSKWREKEAGLESSLREAQQQLKELQTKKDNQQRFILSNEQREAIERFRKKEFEIKQQLKDVRKNLRRDIEVLGIRLKVINIALMPLLVALAGIAYGIHRKKHG